MVLSSVYSGYSRSVHGHGSGDKRGSSHVVGEERGMQGILRTLFTTKLVRPVGSFKSRLLTRDVCKVKSSSERILTTLCLEAKYFLGVDRSRRTLPYSSIDLMFSVVKPGGQI